MARRALKIGACVVLSLALVGCQNFHLGRTPQPELKPPPQPEVLATAPKQDRYNRSVYPDIAYRNMDNFRRPSDGLTENPIVPARASAGSMSPTGMPSSGIR